MAAAVTRPRRLAGRMAQKKKTAAEVARELGVKVDNSKAGKVAVRLPARALKRGGGKPRPR